MGNCQMGNCQMGIAKWELPNGNCQMGILPNGTHSRKLFKDEIKKFIIIIHIYFHNTIIYYQIL